MSLLHVLSSSSSSGTDKLYVEDVFSAYVRTGTGADVVVTTDIDMTKGYMLWTKGRSGATGHAIYDSARGVTNALVTNSTAAGTTQSTGLKSVSTTGHTIGSHADMNTSGATYVDWVMRKAPKFFDVVTYTGDGTTDHSILHSLGTTPAMIIIKNTTGDQNWAVYHRKDGVSPVRLSLNSTYEGYDPTFYFGAITDTSFKVVQNAGEVNVKGNTYVAYLFAHDPSADGIIQCGSFTANASGNATVNLGWEPQYLMMKASSTTSNWMIFDSMRGLPVGSSDAMLKANLADAETLADDFISVNATGFSSTSYLFHSQTYIYLAIRRPMKVPTSGTEVYNAIARTGTGAVATVSGVGFAPDLVLFNNRVNETDHVLIPRLLGTNALRTNLTTAEGDFSSMFSSFDINGVTVTGTSTLINASGSSYINHFFKRAKGFFDIVCYTGTGVARTVNHNLGVVPELIIVKSRNSAQHWAVYRFSDNYAGFLNLTDSFSFAGVLSATDTQITNTATDNAYNGTNINYIAYLFATLAGVQWINSYVGDGTIGRIINCGFTSGARFICIKATSTTGNWWIFDSSRGILAAADPVLALNSTAAEITSADAIDPHSSGFIVNQEATCSINASGVSYLVWAIA